MLTNGAGRQAASTRLMSNGVNMRPYLTLKGSLVTPSKMTAKLGCVNAGGSMIWGTAQKRASKDLLYCLSSDLVLCPQRWPKNENKEELFLMCDIHCVHWQHFSLAGKYS